MAGVQVVHLAVYVYFAASLVGEQWIIKGRSDFKRKDEEVGAGCGVSYICQLHQDGICTHFMKFL